MSAGSSASEALRPLFATHGPVPLLTAVADLCGEQVDRAEGSDLTFWEKAEAGARDAVEFIEDENAELVDDDEGDGMDGELARNGDDVEGVSAGDGTAVDTDSDDAEGECAAPSELEFASDGDEEGHVEQGNEEDEGETIMAKDERLGRRAKNATHWRIKRVEPGQRRGVGLRWDEDGVAVEEWPIRQLSVATISERWGPGRYQLVYICEGEDGRRPCGTSAPIEITRQGGLEASNDQTAISPPLTTPAPAVAFRSNPAPIAAQLLPPLHQSLAMGGDIANIVSLMTLMSEQTERARAIAAADARALAERSAADARIAQERWRAELDAQLERERLASKERIAALEVQARTSGRGGGRVDHEAIERLLTTKLSAFEEQLAELREELEEDEAAAVPAVAQPAAGTTAAMFQPLVQQATQHFPQLIDIAKLALSKVEAVSPPSGVGHAAE